MVTVVADHRDHDRGDGDRDADDAGRDDDPHQRRLERQLLAAIRDHHAGTLRKRPAALIGRMAPRFARGAGVAARDVGLRPLRRAGDEPVRG
jgi:hypothetical protein